MEYLASIGVADTGLSRFITAAYRELGVLTFLTAGTPEVRAWTVRKGAKAPEAAGVIHSDIERGFIRIEVTPFDQLVEAGSEAKAKEFGLHAGRRQRVRHAGRRRRLLPL